MPAPTVMWRPGQPCPACKSTVADQRGSKTKETQPDFRCTNRACSGGGPKKDGSGFYAWGTYVEKLPQDVQLAEAPPPQQPTASPSWQSHDATIARCMEATLRRWSEPTVLALLEGLGVQPTFEGLCAQVAMDLISAERKSLRLPF